MRFRDGQGAAKPGRRLAPLAARARPGRRHRRVFCLRSWALSDLGGLPREPPMAPRRHRPGGRPGPGRLHPGLHGRGRPLGAGRRLAHADERFSLRHLVGWGLSLVGATIGGEPRLPDRADQRRQAAARARRPGAAQPRGRFREDGASYLLFLRLVPLFPFWLVNLVPAFFGVSAAHASSSARFFGMVPGTFVYASVGSGLGALIEAGQTPDLHIVFQPRVLLPLVALAVLALVPVVYKRWRRERAPMTERSPPTCASSAAGSGGLRSPPGRSQLGAKTVLIERGKMGGDCLNYGCVPSKSLLAAARRAECGARAALSASPMRRPQSISPLSMRHVHEVIAAIAPNDSVERFEGLGVRVIRGSARFAGPRDGRGRRGRSIRAAPLRHRDRLGARGAADPRARRRALSHQRDGLREQRCCPSI